MHERERVGFVEIALILVVVAGVTAFGVVFLNDAFHALGAVLPTSIGGSIAGSVGS
jgi:hypothetical protein